MIALGAAILLTVITALASVRLFIGPTLHDRALGARAVLVNAALACAAMAVVFNDASFADAAIILVLAAIVIAAAVTKIFRIRTFQAPLVREFES
jgi:multisubunit Na+/H+ antiporter MnhF subunit